MLLFDFLLSDLKLLALLIGEDEVSPFLAKQNAADDAAAHSRDRRRSEGDVHVAVDVQDVFQDAIEAAIADAVELRPNLAPLAVELVTVHAVLPE